MTRRNEQLNPGSSRRKKALLPMRNAECGTRNDSQSLLTSAATREGAAGRALGHGVAERLDCGGFSTAFGGVPVVSTVRTAALKRPHSRRFAQMPAIGDVGQPSEFVAVPERGRPARSGHPDTEMPRASVRPAAQVAAAARRAALLIALLALALPAFAASVGELVDDRLAVERVYYAKQVGAKAPFEQAVSRSVIERRVQQELLKERVLKNVYRLEITPKLVAEEVARIERSTMAGDMLAQIKLSLANNPERFARSVAKPLVVDRVLRARFEADANQQAGKRAEAEKLRAQLLAAKADERAALLKSRNDVREVTWQLGAKPKTDLASARPSLGAAMPKAYFSDLHADMQKVLAAQLQKPGDVSAVFGSDESFTLYVAASRTGEALTVQAVEISRLTFDDWLTAQARTNP